MKNSVQLRYQHLLFGGASFYGVITGKASATEGRNL